MSKQSEADILAGDSCCGCGRKLGTDSGEREVLSRAARRASPRKERKALAVKGGGKSDEPGTPRGVSGEGKSRISENPSEEVGTKGVSGAVLAKPGTIRELQLGPRAIFVNN